jgi:rubrerythrin
MERLLHRDLPPRQRSATREERPVEIDRTELDPAAPPAATAEILEGLNDLLQLDHDAVGSYEIAMEKLEDRDHSGQISGFLRDHERHIRELNELIAELGGSPVNQPHATGPFKQALQSLGALGGDRGILIAFRTNELQARAKYDGYASKANGWPTAIKRVVDRNALDEERHYRWVAEALAAMGVGSGEGAEVDAIDALRERSTVAGHRIDELREAAGNAADTAREKAGEVRERAGEIVEEVRNRAAEATDAVRNRIAGMMEGEPSVPGGAGLAEPTVRDRAEGVARSAGATLEERFHEQPLRSLLLVGLAGFVLGRMLR